VAGGLILAAIYPRFYTAANRRRAAFAEATLTDANGRLYASATSTLLVFER
jgi:acyl-coenzyme A thioesterase PaaI-like protein